MGERFDEQAVIDAAHIEHQRAWSTETFGPREVRGPLGPHAHLKKELKEVADDPHDLEEWVDVIILAFDGAWRAGHEPQQIIDAVKAKQAKNEARTWPDWRGVPADQAIEHVRGNDLDEQAVRSLADIFYAIAEEPIDGLDRVTWRGAWLAAARIVKEAQPLVPPGPCWDDSGVTWPEMAEGTTVRCGLLAGHEGAHQSDRSPLGGGTAVWPRIRPGKTGGDDA